MKMGVLFRIESSLYAIGYLGAPDWPGGASVPMRRDVESGAMRFLKRRASTTCRYLFHKKPHHRNSPFTILVCATVSVWMLRNRVVITDNYC